MRIVSFLILGIAVTPTAQAGQQTASRPASQVIERTDVSPGRLPWRLLRTTRQTDGRETTTETEQVPDIDGRMAPVRETVVEAIRAGRIVRTNSTTFLGIPGQRRLGETRESIEDSSPDGSVYSTSTTRRPDVNGRLAITERVTEDTAITPDARRTEWTRHRPDLNGQLRPAERTEHTDRQIAPQTARATTTELQMDVNNRWQVTEVRDRAVRSIGTMEEVEETILQRDLNGTLWERERIVSRQTTNQNGQENLLIERFTHDDRYPGGSSLRRTLTSRIQRTATTRANGEREIVEEVEERSPVALDDPLRIVRRTIETVRPTGAGRWETSRQVFERDPNNRLVLMTVETEETTDR